jgi:peptide deformylase
VGIAAPQFGVLQRIVIVDCSLGLHKNKNHGRLIMVNPEIFEQDGEVLGREGCLSVPEWVGTVPRARRVTVRFQDVQGEFHEIQSKAFEARVIQHEIDHLDGILFIDKVVSTKDLIRRMDT